MPIPERDCPQGLTVWRSTFPYRCVRCGECLKRCTKNAVELSHFPPSGIEDIPAKMRPGRLWPARSSGQIF
ncbi:iron-sulfur cluster-binding protein [Dehalococcoides mccartyi 195]|uniref:Iron-sulfur cluster-binding protein n=1 Tax=Dehalococcoides mccartyi (strain ATCC BAA-2266 / KCTC 15142 / 195) TaxID=243164 RepID=Q3Z7S0_DEHM1|nr:iron-sulfur cluster-binding protein [Dehalococcoides mccartyi 195]